MRSIVHAWWFRTMVVLAFVLLSAGVNLRYAHDRIIPTDDNLLMYMTAHVFGDDRVALDGVVNRFVDHIRAAGYDAETVKHYEFRQGNFENYLLHAGGYRLARSVMGEPIADGYGRYVYEVLRLGSHLAHLAVLAVTALVLARIRDGRVALAVLASATIMIAVTATNLVPRPHWRLGAYADPLEFLWAAGVFFLDTGGGWSPWGPAGRAAMTLLLFPLFALRWTGHFGWSYLILFLMCFTHQTYAGIMVLALVSMDAVLRPHVLRHPGVVAAAVATLALFFWRESLWRIFAGVWLPLGLVAVVAAIAGFSWAARRYARLGRVSLVTSLAAMRPMHADMALLAAGMAGLLVVSWGMSRLDDSPTALFVWQEMAARPLALVKIPLAMGLALLVLESRLFARGRRLVLGAVLVSGLAAAGGGLQMLTVARTSGEANATGNFFAEDLEAHWLQAIEKSGDPITEVQAYLAMNRELDLKDSALDALLGPPAPR